MSNNFKLPDKGIVFWPIGTGDSTTIMIRPETALQVDIRHSEKSEDDEATEWPIIDKLVDLLPKRDGRPYLAAFALTHPDKDHVQGFDELNDRVLIGELWYTPRIIRNYEDNEDLCEDALAFRREADRRRKAILENPDDVKSGDRLKVIGHDEILNEDKYAALPAEYKVLPGNTITNVDGDDVSDEFVAFIHAPFSDDQAKDRNNTSLAMHVALSEEANQLEALLLGDREYPTIRRIVRTTEEHNNKQYLKWDVLLTPHHCSKAVMFFEDDDEEAPSFKQDIMDDFEKYAKDDAHIVASALSEFTDGKGDNPPHQRARDKYEEIVDSGHFLCTHETPSEEEPEPIVFEVSESGVTHPEKEKGTAASALSGTLGAARGQAKPPTEHVGFGTVCG